MENVKKDRGWRPALQKARMREAGDTVATPNFRACRWLPSNFSTSSRAQSIPTLGVAIKRCRSGHQTLGDDAWSWPRPKIRGPDTCQCLVLSSHGAHQEGECPMLGTCRRRLPPAAASHCRAHPNCCLHPPRCSSHHCAVGRGRSGLTCPSRTTPPSAASPSRLCSGGGATAPSCVTSRKTCARWVCGRPSWEGGKSPVMQLS